MAEDKKGFILYADQKALFEQLSNEKAGELIKFIFAYVNDENPISEDIIINLAFTPIKQQLKRDLVKFNEIKCKRSEAGRKGMAKRWQSITNDNKALQAITNITVNDNVNDNDNVNAIRIPTLEDFMAWGLSKLEDVSKDALRLKYEAWKVDNWSVTRNGKTEAILNWKKTLNNTLVHLPKEPKQLVKSIEQLQYENVMRQLEANK